MRIVQTAAALALFLFPLCATAAEPVRRVGVEVQPFYQAARTPDGTPQVSVGKQYNVFSPRINARTSSRPATW